MDPMREFKVVDLFCGTGGFSKGFENCTQARFKTILGVDSLPVAMETFRANHATALPICGDIRRTPPGDAAKRLGLKRGAVDVIIGGPPCQGFSSIRPFRSSSDNDPRNDLFLNFASYVDYLRPRVLVMENVVGLATHQSAQAIEYVQETFHRLGYETDWKILNAAHFGVPQRRERLILVGTSRGTKVQFPEPTHKCDERTIGHKDRRRMLLPKESDLFTEAKPLVRAVSVIDAIGDLPKIGSGEAADDYETLPKNDYQRQRRKGSGRLTLHFSTRHTPKMMEIIKHSGPNINSIPRHLIRSGFSSCYSRLDADKPSVTITVNFVHPASNRCIHPLLDRALTPREGARLQSFDDDFTFAGNRSQIVKQIGNAVPPLLGEVIAGTVAEMLGCRPSLQSNSVAISVPSLSPAI